MRIDTLTRMADQIASNNAVFAEPEAVQRVSEHLKSFWTPAMRRDLTAYATEHPDQVAPVVRAALAV